MLSRRGTTIGCIIKLGTSRESTRTNIPSRRRFFSGQPSPSSSNPLRPSTPVQVKDKPIGTSIAAAEHAKHTTSQIIEHRPYQQDSLDACLDALSRGVSRIGVSLPTGSGKTTVFLNLIHKISGKRVDSNETPWRAMVIVNSVELAHQTIRQLKKLFPNTLVGTEQGAKHSSEDAEVVVATYQSLHSKERYRKFDPAHFKCIIVDEAHHALSSSYLQILSYFNRDIDHQNSPRSDNSDNLKPHQVPIIGFSATFSRHDRLALSTVFEEIVYHYELRDMIQAGWLAPARFTSVKVDMDLSQVALTSGKEPDYVPDRLAEVVDTDPINQLLVSIYLERAASRKSTLIFTINILHMYRLANKFREAGIDARVIFSGTPPLERKILLDEFRSSKFPVLVNCAVLTEGADVPNVDCVILARPTRSRTLLTQMIGRGLRKSSGTGKTDCLLIDIFGSVERGVIVNPSLEGLDPNLIDNGHTEESGHLDGVAAVTEDLEEADPQHTPSESVTVNRYTYTDFDSPFKNEPDYKNVGDLYRLTRYSWVACGDGIFVLELLGQGHLRIQTEREETGDIRYVIYFVHTMQRTDPSNNESSRIFTKPQLIGTAETIPDAIKTADAFLGKATKTKKSGLSLGIVRSLERRASWRRLPASEQQITIIKKRLGSKLLEGLAQDFDHLDKGQAANLLTRLNHGFKSRLNRQLVQNSRIQKTLEKRNNAQIKVGKLMDP
ncbi:uncharacterized protein PGTG_14842 [Puccinia graminis f. sp. tritici CRL 75-36-700-3]|uniref:Uncharacterized protein n=1 Tax=Puccinia graminis f. sp. tritici (strain CRL 75-36-700-3 / race SCCL) TaxID=418459 RepID=E3KWG2_PUCGT|nr:uncharacterized protein PGTG_14842 [Puccinia graminis f. sp. tritici CRL 75-36-700-3]EFP88637.1 hypothetical protein PGTG_14842 [Puccinia graminis f. sp. tritici CRL 75-36-700-3]